MGLLSWLIGSGKINPAACNACGSTGMNGAERVRLPDLDLDLTIIAFGEAKNGETLSGYCPVSEKVEPCNWTIVSVKERIDRPAVRILF